MSNNKKVKTLSRFIGGIGEFTREATIQDAYAFGQSIDVRTDPQNITLLPRTIKESGTVIQALPKWGEYISGCDKTYIYDEGGNIYSRDSASAYLNLHTVPNSHGNGMRWFGEDNFLYYTSDTLIGRYGPVCSSTATFVDDFFGSQGGTPLNTHSLDLESSSTQYASRADTASLSITGNLSIEAWIKPESLPTAGNTMTWVSKWTEAGNIRSYKFGVTTTSNYFGDGSDGALTISVNTTDTPIDSAASGTSGSNTLSATNASFVAGQVIMIIQMKGTNAGYWMRNTIQSYVAGTITLNLPLNADYSSSGANRAQVLVFKQYTDVTVNSGITWYVKAWNGTVGGILGFLANGTVTITGIVDGLGQGANAGTGNPGGSPGSGRGFSGGAYALSGGAAAATQGDGTGGTPTTAVTANGNGGGGGYKVGGYSGGGGGGHGYEAAPGRAAGGGTVAAGGAASGTADLVTLTMGGAGGGGAGSDASKIGAGGAGGAIICLFGMTINVTGQLINTGGVGGGRDIPGMLGGGGGGAGGSMLLKGQVVNIGSQSLAYAGGAGGTGNGAGGTGAQGRIHIDYLTSYSGNTTPGLTATQDPNLTSTSGYVIFLTISNNGTATETYSRPINIVTDTWQNVAVVWDQSISRAEFFLTGVSLGTQSGALTTISDNASTFNVGMDRDGSSNPQHLFDGLIDEVRVWAGLRYEADILSQMYQHINSASTGLVGYWQFNAVATDATANANNLTLTGSPVYSTDVPFAAPTTRVDIDQADAAATGNTYALGATISESSADKKSFTPQKDPQKSLRIIVAAKGAGSGSWTLTIHDQYNNIIATKTVTKAALSVGNYEFVFDSVWRPLTNFTNSYHFHLTDSDATGTVQTTSSNDLSTVNYTTYYQFLISDTSFHPVDQMLQFLIFGNERYVATLEATIYEPNALTLPAGWRVQCFGNWQEYKAIGVMKGDAITDQDMGRIYFWDGIAGTYNFYVDVPQGGVTALLGAHGRLFIWAGYQGEMLVYEGGNSVTKARQVPFMRTTSYSSIYPAAVTMWKSLIRYGVAGESNSTDIYRGVYTFGSTNYKYPDILTFDYPISTGNTQSTTVRVGLVMPVEKKLLIGWADGIGYGVDYVDSSNDSYPTGTIEFLIDDSSSIWKEKLLTTFVTKFKTLEAGHTITPKVRLDDTTTWSYSDTVTSSFDDPTIARFVLSNERNYEVQYGLDIATTIATPPTIKGSGVEIDLLEDERRV